MAAVDNAQRRAADQLEEGGKAPQIAEGQVARAARAGQWLRKFAQEYWKVPALVSLIVPQFIRYKKQPLFHFLFRKAHPQFFHSFGMLQAALMIHLAYSQIFEMASKPTEGRDRNIYQWIRDPNNQPTIFRATLVAGFFLVGTCANHEGLSNYGAGMLLVSLLNLDELLPGSREK